MQHRLLMLHIETKYDFQKIKELMKKIHQLLINSFLHTQPSLLGDSACFCHYCDSCSDYYCL